MPYVFSIEMYKYNKVDSCQYEYYQNELVLYYI
jgi:hypothetical protein